MQVQLRFQTRNLIIPLSYHYQVQSMLYSLMRQDTACGAEIHEHGYQMNRREFRLFCFGSLTGQTGVDSVRKELLFIQHADLEVRTADPKLSELLMRLLRPGLELTLCGQRLQLESVEMADRRITKSQCRIKALSPILAYRTMNGERRSYNPLQAEFCQLIADNFGRKYQAFTGTKPEPIQLIPKAVGAKDKTVTNYKGSWLTGWGGEYRLKGKPEYLNFLYNTGLGPRNAAGFGMFELI